MAYFKHLPDCYIGKGIDDDESFNYQLVKNIFRRISVRDDLEKYITMFEVQTLPDGIKPFEVAKRVTGDEGLDWLILILNNITDIYEQWPKKEEDLTKYVLEKYGSFDDIHHYETQRIVWEVPGEEDIVIFNKGIEVNESFRATLPDGTVKSKELSIYPVSNYEHESFVNDKKRFIKIPTVELVNKMLSEIDELLSYEYHSELDDFNNKKTLLNVAQRFLDTRGYVSGSETISLNQLGTIVSYDNGPGSTTVSIEDAEDTTAATTQTTTSTTTTSTTTTTTTLSSSTTRTFDGGEEATSSY